MNTPAAQTLAPRDTPRRISSPPSQFPGMLAVTTSAVSSEAVVSAMCRSPTMKVGSHTMMA